MLAEDKKRALKSIMLSKEKKDGTVKGQNTADGGNQHDHVGKAETASSTVKSESTFTTGMIEAKEGCNITTIGAPNAFLKKEFRMKKTKWLCK